MRAALETVGWVVVGLIGGSSVVLVAYYLHEERQFRRVNRRRR